MTPTLADVETLVRSESSGELSGSELINQCTRLALLLQPTNTSANPVPRHYLSGADIRTRDPEYAKVQLKLVLAALSHARR